MMLLWSDWIVGKIISFSRIFERTFHASQYTHCAYTGPGEGYFQCPEGPKVKDALLTRTAAPDVASLYPGYASANPRATSRNTCSRLSRP